MYATRIKKAPAAEIRAAFGTGGWPPDHLPFQRARQRLECSSAGYARASAGENGPLLVSGPALGARPLTCSLGRWKNLSIPSSQRARLGRLVSCDVSLFLSLFSLSFLLVLLFSFLGG